MSEDRDLAWGVPADAPPPRHRSAWGNGTPAGAPAPRGSQQPAAEPEPEVGAVGWAPIIDPGEDPVLTDTPLAEDPEVLDDAVVVAEAPVGPADVEVAASADEPAIPLDDDVAYVDLPAEVDESTFFAPAPVTDETGGDLMSMFDDAPAEVADEVSTAPAVPAVPGEPEPFASREEALHAWRTSQERRLEQAADQATALQAQVSAELAHRYSSEERLRPTVDRILALAQTGSPRVQAMVNSLRLTRDAALDARQRAEYEQVMLRAMSDNAVYIENPADAKTVLDIAYDEVIGIGPLGPLWRDDDVTEILVSGPDKVVAERNGELVPTPVKFRGLEHLQRTARDLAQRIDDRTVSRSNPLVTAQLPGARVQFALAPVTPLTGVSISIRKFRPLFGLRELLQFGALDEQMAAFLSDAVRARSTILVSGGTGTGKTTMINALSAFIPDSERVITIEDALELSLSNSHVESLLTKEVASGDDRIVIGQDELLKASLRMRPDRIIVGEIRDGHGCATMLQAANTGHDGTMTTVHANNPDAALRRLALLLRSTSSMSDDVAGEEVRSAFDLVVQVSRFRRRRFISAISLVPSNGDRTIPVFAGRLLPDSDVPTFERVTGLGADTELAQRMYEAGIDPSEWE